MASRAILLDHLPLDRCATEPLQAQLYRQIRAAILDGLLASGTPLPPTRRLAEDLGIARNTVLGAYDRLISEGYVESRSGAASRVSTTLPDGPPPAGPLRPPAQARPLSDRGQALAGMEAGRDAPAPGIFTPGIPALDRFPVEPWRRLVSRAWRRHGTALLAPVEPAGWLALRQAIAAHLGPARGVQCTADQILVVASTRQAIQLAAMLLAAPGDTVWIEDPGYLGARAGLTAAGLRLVPVPVDADGLVVEAGLARAPDARLAYVTPSHQYPLGGTLSLGRRLDLLAWARDSGVWILEDDYDGEFRHAGRPITALQGLDGDGRVIYLGTFSKALFPALRLGYLVLPLDLTERFAAGRVHLDGHAPAEPQAALAAFIADGLLASHVRRMRRLYAERRRALLAGLDSALGRRVVLHPADTGLHLAITWTGPRGDAEVAADLAARGVTPGVLSRYYLGAPAAPGLVLGYGQLTPAQLRRGLAALAAALGDRA